MPFEVNIWAVIVAAITGNVFGWFWYSPLGLGKPWMKEMGLTPEHMQGQKGSMAKMAILSLVSSLLLAAALAYVLSLYIVFDIQTALTIGVVLWVGVTLPILAASALYESKSWKLVAINAGYRLVEILVIAAIIGWWQ